MRLNVMTNPYSAFVAVNNAAAIVMDVGGVLPHNFELR
jgi:hypothetical protein